MGTQKKFAELKGRGDREQSVLFRPTWPTIF